MTSSAEALVSRSHSEVRVQTDVVVYASTVLIASFLLFQIQPMASKALLPKVGGSAAVWTICMLFFQTMLLLGYTYAHVLSSYASVRVQVLIHGGLLVSAVFGVVLSGAWGLSDAQFSWPPAYIVRELLASVGLPYFVLCTTSPLVQAWHARVRRGKLPYWLFAISNAASLSALLSYPVLIEPFTTLRSQTAFWSLAFVVFAVLSGAAAFILLRRCANEGPAKRAKLTRECGSGSVTLWFLLSACASTLFLAGTNTLCQDIAPVPFLWVLPLVVYLLSFVLCFGSEGMANARAFRIGVIPAGAVLMGVGLTTRFGVWTVVPAVVAALFLLCMFCHGELFKLRPSAANLTSFYITMAFGGAFGGLFVGVIGPFLFKNHAELYISVFACIVIAQRLWRATPGSSWNTPESLRRLRGSLVTIGVMIAVCAVWPHFLNGTGRMGRNFYGTLRTQQISTSAGEMKRLLHGSTMHGAQFESASLRRLPTTYYGPASAIGLVLSAKTNEGRHIGVIGLGVGTIAAYARSADRLRIYEINPLVQEIASQEFTFLRDCPAPYEIVMGDARISPFQRGAASV